MREQTATTRLYQRTVKIKSSSLRLLGKLLLFIVMLVGICESITFQELAVTADSYIINTLTRYTIIYDRTQQNYGIAIDVNSYPVPAGSNMTLTVPSVYSVNLSLGVSASVNNGMVQYPNFTITSNTINIYGLFPTQSIVYNVTIALINLLNPSPAITTDSFTGTIGSDYAEPIYLRSVVVLQPAQFQSCYMTFSPAYVNRTGAMIVTIKTKTSTPYNGVLQIVFPSNTWSQGSTTSSTNYLPITSSMSCSNLSTNIKSTLICNGTQNQNKITISNMFSTDLPAESTISFQINNFLSPPTNKAADLIKISSLDSSSNQINTCSEYVTDLVPNVLSSSKITITNGGLPLTVNQQYTIRFMFETVDVFAITDYFQVQFPSGSNFTFNSNLLTGGINLIKTTATYSSNLLRCYMNTALSVKIYSNPFTMYIATGTYTAPPSIESTGNFKISLMRNGYPMQVGYQSLTAVSSTLNGSLTAMGTYVVNKVTSYTLSVTINDALSSNGKIRVKFPTEVSLSAIASSSCAQLTGTSLTSTPSCTVNTIQNTIELTNINSSTSIIPTQTFTITFTNITNPFSTAPTSTFQVRTFYKSTDGSLVAIGSLSGFTPKEAMIDASNVVVNSLSYVVLDQSVTYQLKYTVDNYIDLSGSFIMFVPKPIIVNTAVLSSNCKRGLNTISTTTTPCVLVSEDGMGYIINFTSPLSSTQLTKDQFIVLQLTSLITNPPSTSPVSTFKLYSYSSLGYLIAKIQSSLSIQMTDPTTLTTASYTRDSNKNYDLTNYQFTIKQRAQIDISSVVAIQFPSEILPNVSSLCGMTLPYVNTSLSCSLVNQSVVVIILPTTMAIGVNTALTLTVSNVRNPTSFRPPGDFLIRTFTANQTYKYAQGLTSNKIANNIPSSFALITGSYSPGVLDADITLTVSFTPAYQAPGYLQLSIPSYFTIPSSLSCSQVANFNGTCQIISTLTIQITGQFTSNGMITFQISGIRSTIRSPTSTQYAILSSFTSDNYQLDYSSNSIVFALTCNFPCMTCDPVNESLCLSCYNNSLITDKINFDNNTGSCYSQCPDGKYQDSLTLLCQNCDSNCATCQGSSTFCTTCNQSTVNKYLNVISTTSQQCVSQCQDMMYPDITRTPPTCVVCQSPCKTCTSLTFCLTCLDTYYFWENTCIRTCPINVTVGDNTTGNCVVCNTSCLTCLSVADTCTSCNSTLILYNNKCITACVAPLVYRPEISTCGPCDTQCKTCSNTGSNCTSCDPLSLYAYYFNFNCLQSCPDLYYENVGTCSLCSSLNMNCDYCANQTYCDKCNLGFVFFNGQCLASTPNGYVNISGFAQACSGDCATCVIIQTNCTSCKTLNLFGNGCQSNCPSGYIPLSNLCTPCQSPCLTCSENVNNCTSCIQNLTPKVYYLQNFCDTSCPDFYYADNGTAKCQPCQSPCLKCSDLVTCTSCVDNYFLYQQNTCLTACPSQFVGINKVCQACLSPCKTCTDSTTKCLTCQSGYFYLAATNQCLLDCGNGLYEDYINQTCISCTPPCNTCANTTNTCLSCLTGILYNNLCLTQCPVKMYNDTNTCQSCPSVCSSCSSSTICLSCTSPYILYNSYCITKCPDTYAVIINNTCTQCSTTNCHKCYDNDVCFNCISDYSLLNGACLSVCPDGYKTNGTNCIEILSSSLSSSGNMFPVPMTIATAVVLVACMMSKLQNHRTFLAGGVYSLVGIIQTLALGYYIYLYYVNDFYPQYPIGMYIALASLGLLYALNLFSIIQSIVLCYDKRFCSWRDSSILNKLYNMFSTFISISISHKFKNLMFSRLFAFMIFSAQLEDVKKFKILNIYSFISLAHSGGCIFSVITIIKLVDVRTQFFHACLDLLIVVGLNIIVSFFNAFKGSDYFDEPTAEGYLLGKKMYADEDSYNAKVSVGGNDMQNEQGHGCYSKINHTLASNQAFKFKQSDQSRQDINSRQYSDSLTHVIEKQYEDISVQAYDILNQQQSTLNRVNFSTLKIQHNNLPEQSKFTTIFSNYNQDKSVQNTIDCDGRVKKNSVNSYEKGRRVDYSVQKYSDAGYVDRSIQGTIQQGRLVDRSIQGTLQERGKWNDFSVQYTNDNGRLQKDASIQGTINPMNRQNDVSVQGTIDDYVDQSGQYSHLQSQKGVQKMLLFNDRSVQQTIDRNEWNGQNTIDMKSISIQKQKEEDNFSHYENEQMLEQQNQQNENDGTLIKNSSENIFYIDEKMQDEIDEIGNECLPQIIDQNKETIVVAKQQQVPQQKQDDFDLPADEIIYYQQELEQKILAKQKELERVRKEIQVKEREQKLKERLMRQERDRIEKEKQKEKQNEKKKEMQKKKEQKDISSYQQKREEPITQGQVMQLPIKEQQSYRRSIFSQQQQEKEIKLITISDKNNNAVQNNHQHTHQLPQPILNTIIHQLDQTTSIDHSQVQVSPPIISTPHFDQSQQNIVKIRPQQINSIQQMKQDKLHMEQNISQRDDKTESQLDEQELFLNGELMVRKSKRNNYQVDIYMDIKQNDQDDNNNTVNVKDKNKSKKDNEDNSQESQSGSVKTKAKNKHNNSRRRPIITAQSIQNTRQIEVKSNHYSKQQSMVLGIESSQPLDNVIPQTTIRNNSINHNNNNNNNTNYNSYDKDVEADDDVNNADSHQQQQHNNQLQQMMALPTGVLIKQPGKIRTIFDQLKSNIRQEQHQHQQQQQQVYENHQKQAQQKIGGNLIIQMEDNDYNDDIENNDHLEQQETNQRRGNFIYQEENGELREEDEIDFRRNANNNNNNIITQDKNTSNANPFSANESLPLSDHQLPQQELVYHYNDNQSLQQQQFDQSQDIPYIHHQHLRQKTKVKKNSQSDNEDYSHHVHRRDQHIALNHQRSLELTKKQSQLIKSLNNQSQSIKYLQNNSSKKKFIPQQPQSHTQALKVNIDKLRGYQYGGEGNGQNETRRYQQKQGNRGSRSLLANNAAQNIVASTHTETAENQTLRRKLSSKHNPLRTQKKWQHSQEQRLNSIPQSSQANDSQIIQTRNKPQNLPKHPQSKSTSQQKQPPQPPTETDKQETSFSHLGQKVAVQSNRQHQKSKPSTAKSFNGRGEMKRNAEGFSQHQRQQIDMHFEKEYQTPNQRNNVQQRNITVHSRRSNDRSNRTTNLRPTTTLTSNNNSNNKNPAIHRQFESQQIFGNNPNPSSDAQQYSQGQTEFNPSVSKLHRNNLIIDKMMDRPDNDDLYEYYNRASTHRGKNNKKRSNEKKQINLSREKKQNDKKIEKIYLQRLDGSNSQIPRSKSRGRY